VCRNEEVNEWVVPLELCRNEVTTPAMVKYHFKAQPNIIVLASPAKDVCHRNEAVVSVLPATNDEPIVPSSPAIDEYRCSICHLHINLRRCNVLYKYCEKHERYSVDHVPNTVYDLYYNKWLPVASNVADNHYADIEEQRAKIRAFDVGHANSSFSVSALYMKHLTRIAMYVQRLVQLLCRKSWTTLSISMRRSYGRCKNIVERVRAIHYSSTDLFQIGTTLPTSHTYSR
jgi:hypothetical protein